MFADMRRVEGLWGTLGHGHSPVYMPDFDWDFDFDWDWDWLWLWLVLDFCTVLGMLYVVCGDWLAFNIWQQLSKKLERVSPRRRKDFAETLGPKAPKSQVKVGDVFVLFVIATTWGVCPFSYIYMYIVFFPVLTFRLAGAGRCCQVESAESKTKILLLDIYYRT